MSSVCSRKSSFEQNQSFLWDESHVESCSNSLVEAICASDDFF